MQEDEFPDEERRSDMSDDQLSDNGMDEEDNFDFLLKRT
jgi:hypothetical protein